MACKKWIVRILRITALAVLAVLLLAFAAVQFQQRLLRYRAERLMADMHQIRLYQSTWADAQRLMYRWGAWGHYDGSCTEANCRYAIEVGDPIWGLNAQSYPGWMMRANYILRGSGLFGGRWATLRTTLTVHNGTIWRETATIAVDVPPGLRHYREPNLDYLLIIETRSRQRLLRSPDDDSILGSDEQLAEHPYYKADRAAAKIALLRALAIPLTRRSPKSTA